MTRGNLGRDQHVADADRQFQQAHGVGHGGAVLADALRDVLLAHVEVLREAGVGLRLLDGVQPFALQVFNQRHLQHILVAGFADNDGNFLEPKLA